MKHFILLLILVGLAYGNESRRLFSEWQGTHQKTYGDSLEAEQRFLIFQHNLEIILEMNIKQVGGLDVEFGTNQFSDMTNHEFKNKILMPETTPQQFENDRYLSKINVDAPSSFDWREHGAVSEVKDQGSCGTCWAFSTTGNIEGVEFLKTGVLVRRSEEQLVECDGTQDVPMKRANCGVYGGWPYLSYQYIIKNGGMDPEDDYPYCVSGGTFEKSCWPCMAPGWTKELCGPPIPYCDATKWTCRTQRHKDAVVLSDWAAISQDEEDIAAQLVKLGPLSIGMNASMLQFYRKGVFDPLFCNKSILNHAVLLVGFGGGDEDGGKLFWTIKNSWGAKWGEQGYLRIARGKGKCGVNTLVATAIL